MKAPLKPPTELEANMPPFFTASLSMATAAVEPGRRSAAMPSILRISPMLSPTVGVGASERSTMPKGTPNSAATSRPINSPTRVTRKLVILISSARSPRLSRSPRSMRRRRALLTTPGPETPILMAASGSPEPM